MSRRIGPPMLLVFVLFAAAAAGEGRWDSEFANSLYNTPKGWSTTQQSGVRALIPPDLKRGEQAEIVITPGARLTGDFKQAFGQLRADLRGNMKAAESAMQSATADEGYPVLYIAERLVDEKGAAKQFRYYLASNPQKQIELVMLVANTEAVYQRYAPVFEEFIKTLSYKSVHPGVQVTSAPSTAPAR